LAELAAKGRQRADEEPSDERHRQAAGRPRALSALSPLARLTFWLSAAFVLTEPGRRLEATLSPDSVPATIAGSVREALRVPYAAVTLHGAGGTQAAAESGTPGPVALRQPLVFGPEQVGELAVAPRQPGEPLGAADHRLLADFARQAGAAATRCA
jgi:hypothetical protein